MEAKDKAKEIFDKMYATTDMMGNYPMCFDTAKQCALIACKEIIETYSNKNLIYPKEYAYFKKVEQEINQL